MTRRLPAVLFVVATLALTVCAARAEPSFACLGSQVGAVTVSVSAHTIDNSARQSDQGGAYRGLILDDLQSLGLRTVERQATRPVHNANSGGDQATIRIVVSLNSSERRLTSAYLAGDQWPLRTVTLTVSASANDARTSKLLAAMDVPAMNLAGASTTEAVSDYLTHDFRDALAKLLRVACSEPSQAPMPATPIAQPLGIASRGGGAVLPDPLLPPVLDEAKRHIAIVVGISRYANLSDSASARSNVLINLQFADADAKALSETLRTSTGLGNWMVHPFINQDATRVEVLRFIKNTLENAKSTDVILLFFAGHGTADGQADVTLMTYDSHPDVPNDGLSMDWLKDEFKKSPALQIIGLIDACHSGSNALGGRRGKPGSFNEARLLQLQGDEGRLRTLIASSSDEQAAFEDMDLQHGVFTYFLLQAIKGPEPHTRIAGGDYLSMGGLFDYLRQNVSTYVQKRFSAEQVPSHSGNLYGVFNNYPIAARVN